MTEPHGEPSLPDVRTADDSGPGKSLRSRLVVQRDGFRLDLTLDVRPGEVVALLGPNGAGKSTALRALAGLVPLDDGYIDVGPQRLDDPRADRFVSPERRSIGVVFQDYLLFPHLTALDNVAFGPRCRGASKAHSREIAAGWLTRVGLSDLARRKPRQLSGGQAQRVALARALAVEPALLLLDEPLAALDARTRLDTRSELSRHLRRHPGATVIVTHDPLDALVLADRLIIVEDGAVVQEGDANAITARPRTDYVARLVGLNLYRGQGSGHTVTLPNGFALTASDTVDGEAFVAFPPSAVALYPTPPEGSPRNTWPATVTGVTRHGDNMRVQLTATSGLGRGVGEASADVTPAAAGQLKVQAGQLVWAAVKASETRAYPA